MEKIYKGEIQRLLPIFQAIADGRTIQFAVNDNDWIDIDGDEDGFTFETLVSNPQYYRIKPEPKCRPFANAEECWKEMQKHQPFGWVKNKDNGNYSLITDVDDIECEISLNGCCGCCMDYVRIHFTFADGVPFGVKEEE